MEYPLVIETGETFLTHRTLLRFIREKCGDAVAEYLSSFLVEDAKSVKNAEMLKKIRECVESIGSSIGMAENDLSVAIHELEKAGIE